MGANLKSYPTSTTSIDVRIRGLYETDQRRRIEKQCLELAREAEKLISKDEVAVTLVTYSEDRYKIFGLGFGPWFPTGSKIELAKLSFEVVDDRFESAHPKKEDVAKFESTLRSQIELAVTNFSTDLHD